MFKSNALNERNSATDTITYVAIPVEAFQAATAEQLQTINVTHNLILKTLPNGNIQLIDSSNVSVIT